MQHPVDRHVGARIRARRLVLGTTQQTVAARLGVTFQQVQKYELGINRVSASRLWLMAQVLSVPVEYFYDGLPVEAERGKDVPKIPANAPADSDSSALLRCFAAIDPSKRTRLLDLARSLAYS